jgi:glyoxylase I family protein
VPLLGIHHVAVVVDDLDAALAFYGRLGMAVDPSRPEIEGAPGAWLDVGPNQVHLIVKPEGPVRSAQHMALAVADLDGVIATLEAAGATVRQLPAMDATTLRQATVRDPAGNLIELREG